PLAGLQIPCVAHGPAGGQTTAVVPTQSPLRQVSPDVQAFSSSHASPSLPGRFSPQTPVAGSPTPCTWHWNAVGQTRGLLPMHTPATQVSLCVQRFPSSQELPVFGVLGEQRLVLASQVPWFSHWPAGVQVTAWFELHGPAAHPSAWMQTVAAPPLFSTFGSLSEVTFQTLVNLAPSPSSAGTCSTSWK